jgi:uncharacterized protein (DUF1684 family)
MTDNQKPEITPENHLSEINEWHSNRLKELKKPEGWLSVIGLHWLEPGENTFGSDPSSNVVFPDLPGVPSKIGSFFVDKNLVRMDVEPGVDVAIEGKIVTSEVVLGKSKRPVTSSLESLQWTVIKRKDLIGLRLRNTANPDIDAFEGIPRYPVSLAWRIPARFERYDPPKKIKIPNVLGQTTSQPSPGTVVFSIGQEEHRLDTTGSPESKAFFIVFGDTTNGQDTYERGRFITIEAPDDQGHTFIDFNKAYNPPCAFTDYATCPMPPTQNQLPVRIEAGEKNSTSHKH